MSPDPTQRLDDEASWREQCLDRLVEPFPNQVRRALVGEGLLECEGRVVSAVPLSDFTGWLQKRPEFPKTGG